VQTASVLEELLFTISLV